MGGIAGWINCRENLHIEKDTGIVEKMAKTLERRGPDSAWFYHSENAILGQRSVKRSYQRLSEKIYREPSESIYSESSGGIDHPSNVRIWNENEYSIVYDGTLFNAEDVAKKLDSGTGHTAWQKSEHDLEEDIGETQSRKQEDTEIILSAYLKWGRACVDELNGVFAFCIWDKNKKEAFVVRDRLGVKPLFYTFKDGSFLFASEIKGLLAHPMVSAKIDEIGLCEIFGLGPARTHGNGIFKDICELKPGCFAMISNDGISRKEYWSIKNREHTENFGDTVDHTAFLLEDSIKRQLVSDHPVSTLLSGGLDSSIITHFAAKYPELYNGGGVHDGGGLTGDSGLNGDGGLKTLSVDYVDNDINFKPNDFQPNSDNYYIDIMSKVTNAKHTYVLIDTPQLADALYDAMSARDLPGMADVDASLLLFSQEVKKQADIAIGGECADEIFGGYPWFQREDLLNSDTFPWSQAIDGRNLILRKELADKINIRDYVNHAYGSTVKECPMPDRSGSDKNTDGAKEDKICKMFYLNMKWFMTTLLDRGDRMAMHSGLEIRAPFCDYRLVEYMWNVPWAYKNYNGREKGLLRHAMKGILPEEIIERKKSPYPKTHNPNYLEKVKGLLTDVLNDKNSPVLALINQEYVKKIIDSNGQAFEKPWYGQLMTGPQLMAYLIQVDMWLKKYNISF